MFSCGYFNNTSEQGGVARVNNTYLSRDELINSLPANISKEDSLLFVKQFVNNWATKQILKEKAQLNLNKDVQSNFDRLTNAYKLDLYSNAYLNILVSKELDTVVSSKELLDLYDKMKRSFILNEDLIQYRFICLDNNHKDINELKERIKNFSYGDKEVLDSLSIQFHSYRLNDSIWVKETEVYKDLPLLIKQGKSQLLKKSNFLSLEDSLSLYLVQVKDLLKRGEQAPLIYVTPTLEQIILNKRKLELIKQLEIDIRKDALQNNEFEIYN